MTVWCARSVGFVACLVLLLAGCEREAAREIPAGTLELEGGAQHWQGWLELEPAIRTPITRQGVDRTQVFARLPRGAVIALADPSDRRSLQMPPGAELDRVESREHEGRWLVADVRGTLFTERGELFHAYRPLDGSADARLFGRAWERGAADEAHQATEAMSAALLSGAGFLTEHRSAPRQSTVARYQRLLACAGCHGARTPERERGMDEWPRRTTDASGLYSILALLDDDAIVETYRPRDANAGDPFVRVACEDGSLPSTRDAGWPRCADGRVPLAHLDVPAARASHDARVERVCAARRALSAYLTDDARSAWARELDECR